MDQPKPSHDRSRPLRILLVEETSFVRYCLADELRHEGHRVTTAADGIEAAAYAGGGNFDAILLAHRALTLDGRPLADHLNSRCPQARVVLLSGTPAPAPAPAETAPGARQFGRAARAGSRRPAIA